jgi:hypothetical protein
MVGATFGGGKVDDGCASREDARSYMLMGSRISACKVMIQTKQSRKAGVTLEDCLAIPEPPAPVVIYRNVPAPVQVPLPAPPPQVVFITLPAVAPIPLPTPVAPKLVVKKRIIHHMPPDCQNVVQVVCKSDTKKK